jgi:uncharacterized membrane protein ArfB
MDFVMQWLWYLLAFVAGSALAWMIVTVQAKRASRRGEHLPDSQQMGAG